METTMAIVLELARPEVHLMAREILESHHPELRMGIDKHGRAEYPTLCIMMASGAENASSVQLHGYDCAAVIKVVAYDQRVDSRRDAEIKIDQRTWDEITEPQQRALLDHEITHLELVIDDKTGIVKTDDAGRPKLRLRLHDWQLGGFRSISQRYGPDALEVMEARKFQERYGDVALKAEKVPEPELFMPATV